MAGAALNTPAMRANCGKKALSSARIGVYVVDVTAVDSN